MRITIAAPAKVNLWLRVGPEGSDGYHAIDTLYCGLDLADTVVVAGRSGPHVLETTFAPPLESAPELGAPEQNLAVRAAEAFLERAGLDDPPSIRLVKRIHPGGGLGGGSSDAAAVLRALSRLHPAALSDDDLLDLAAGLGSDVPFFVLGRPLSRGTGRGEKVAPLAPLPARPVVLVAPPFAVPTAEAYRWLDEDRGRPPVVGDFAEGRSEGAAHLDWGEVAQSAVNDFEGPVFGRYPLLQRIRDVLRDAGARPALLAGSGSTVFGVFDDSDAASAAAASARRIDPELRVTVTATRTR